MEFEMAHFFKKITYFSKLSDQSLIGDKLQPANDPWHVRAVVVAQLVEWLLPIPEVRSSNPVNGKK